MKEDVWNIASFYGSFFIKPSGHLRITGYAGISQKDKDKKEEKEMEKEEEEEEEE